MLFVNYKFRVVSYRRGSDLPIEDTTTPAFCLSASSVMMSATTAAILSSIWLMGSSSRIKSNGWQTARTIATRCCCPHDNFSHSLSATQRVLPYRIPMFIIDSNNICRIEKYLSLEIAPIAIHIAEKRRLTLARVCLYEIFASFIELYVCLPDIRL